MSPGGVTRVWPPVKGTARRPGFGRDAMWVVSSGRLTAALWGRARPGAARVGVGCLWPMAVPRPVRAAAFDLTDNPGLWAGCGPADGAGVPGAWEAWETWEECESAPGDVVVVGA